MTEICDEVVRRANREIYNSASLREYNENESIFNEEQTLRLRRVLREMRNATRGERFLDIGCGTGNLLRLAGELFPMAIGVDQAERLLSQLARREGLRTLAAGQAHRLPFEDHTFDAAGMYALLHHLYDPRPALREVFRVLRPGGMLYTDHDPNYFFGRFYRLWYHVQFRGTHGFGSEVHDLAEYHHVFTGGLNPRRLAVALEEIGFREVRVEYRHPTNPAFRGGRRWTLRVLQGLSRVLPLKSLYTHFLIRAVK